MSGGVQGTIRPVIQVIRDGGVRVVEVLVPGREGQPGPPGLGSEGYVFNQPTPSGSWTINHNLGYRPSVAVFDSGSQEIDAEVSHPSVNTTILTLNPPTAGFARLI